MLKRETFVNAIQALQKQAQLTEQINHIYQQMTEGEGNLEMGGLTQIALIQTLEDGMEDVHGYISWWLYDAPEDSKVVSWKEDGETVTVDLADINDLYDYLVRSAEERRQINR